MNKPKRSLRSALDELIASFADAVLAAARESLFELAAQEQRPQTRRAIRAPRERTKAARPSPRATPPRPMRVVPEAAPSHEAASDLLITDPQALLTALDAAGPRAAWNAPHEAPPREEPEILRPVSAVTASPTFAPALREGEVVVRRSAGGVVLRRRRA